MGKDSARFWHYREESAALITRHRRERHIGIVREEQTPRAVAQVAEEPLLLVDQQLGEAVVPHRDREVHPRDARNQVARKKQRTQERLNLGQRQARRVPMTVVKPESVSQRTRAFAVHQLQPPGALQQLVEDRDEGRSVPIVRRLRPLPRGLTGDEDRVVEQ